MTFRKNILLYILFLITIKSLSFNDTLRLNNTTIKKHIYIKGNCKMSGTITIEKHGMLFIDSANISFDPNTKVIIKNNAKLYVLKSYLHACNAMWDGMYLYNNSNIQLEASTIEDAKRAVIDTLGAKRITAVNVLFNKNYEGIVLKRANTTTNLKLENNVFACDVVPAGYQQAIPLQAITITPVVANSLPSTNLLVPYSTQKSYSGISLFQTRTTVNANQYVELNKYNLFDKLRYGIVATRSRLLVQKCSFQNLTTFTGEQAGVYIYGRTTGFPSWSSEAQIGGTVNQANTFENCRNGILSKNRTTLSISNNTLTTIAFVGISVSNNIQQVDIDKNKLNDCLIGIDLFNNINIKATITNNRLKNPSNYGDNSINFGIFAGNVTATNLASRNYNLYNNYIDGYYNGIYVSTTFSAQVTDNEVHLRPDNTMGHFQTGIRLENTNTAHVYNNIIDKATANLGADWQIGIYANTNITPRVWCNSIDNVASSIKFDGLNLTASTGNGVIGNVMNHAHYGIWLDHQAEIGNQFINIFGNAASDNQWWNFSTANPQTYTEHASNISGSKMYTKGSSGLQYYLNNVNAINVFDGSQKLSGNYSYPSASINCNNNTPTPAMMLMANNVANNSMGFAGNVNNMRSISKRQLLQNIRSNNVNVNSNSTLKAFVDSAYTTHLGQFYQVDSLLTTAIITNDSSLLNTASSLNNAIVNTGNIVYNKQTLTNWYIAMQNQEPDSTTLADLRAMAIKCPNLEGDAVFQARSILMGLEGISYTSICDNYTSSHKLASNTDEETNTPIGNAEVNVYPNPSNGNITIDYTKVEGKANPEIIIYNSLGAIVWQKQLTESSTTINLESLDNGIYMYCIKQGNEIIKTNKLIVAK